MQIVTGSLYGRMDQSKDYRGYAVSSENGTPTIYTIKDLCEAADAAGLLPSELIAQAWPQHVPSAPED